MTQAQLDEKVAALADKVHSLSHMQSIEEKEVKTLMHTDHRPETTLHAESAPSTKAFQSFLRKGDTGNFELKDLSATGESTGGLLVPTELSSTVHAQLQERSFFRSLAKVTQISTDTFESLVSDEHADAGWTDETSQRPESASPKFKKIKIPAHEIYSRQTVTQRLIDDASLNIEEWLLQNTLEQIAQKETAAFISGNGENQPNGLLKHPDLQTMKTGKDSSFKEKNPEDTLFDLMAQLQTPYLHGSCWIMSRSAEMAIRKLRDPNQMHFLWEPAQGMKRQARLLGYPVYVTDHMPALTNTEDKKSVLFGNFREAYQIVDRQDITIARDPFSKKPFVEFYFTKRVGGNVINPNAFIALSFSA